MRPRDRSAQHDRRRLIERIADKRSPTLLSGASSIAGSAGLAGVNEISTSALDAAGWYDWRWTYRVPIIVDRSKVAGSCANFPLYLSEVNMPVGFFAAAQASGNDVLVTAADGVTKLAHDLVHWYPYGTGAIEDAGRLLSGSYGADVDCLPTRGYGDYGIGPTMELHALLPMLDPEPIDDAGRLLTRAYGGDPGYLPTRGFGSLGDSTLDVVAWVYAGNLYAADQRNAAGVWGDYSAVWHLGEASGDAVDATGNGNTGVDNCDPQTQTGKLFATGGTDFDGGDYFNQPAIALGGAACTWSAWVKPDNPALTEVIFTNGDAAWPAVGTYATNTSLILSGSAQRRAEQTGLSAGAWAHLMVTYSAAGVPTCYINGAEVGYLSNNSWSGAESYIGRRTAGSYFNGALDEMRLLVGSQRSAAWAAAECANHNAPATFYSVGTPQIARL